MSTHRIKGDAKRTICAWVEKYQLRPDHLVPENYGPPIDGLQIVPGYHCLADGCDFLTASVQLIKQHASREHAITSAKAQQQLNAYKDCHIQRLFQNRYGLFAVSMGANRSVPDNSQRMTVAPVDSHEHFRTEVDKRFDRAWKVYTRDRLIDHANGLDQMNSEILPWLKVTGFESMLEGHDLDAIRMSLAIPEKDHADNSLLDRRLVPLAKILHSALKEIYDHIGDMKLPTLYILNSFHSDSASIDPFSMMQTEASFAAYCRCMVQMLCFTARVHHKETSLERICILNDREKGHMDALFQVLGARLDDVGVFYSFSTS